MAGRGCGGAGQSNGCVWYRMQGREGGGEGRGERKLERERLGRREREGGREREGEGEREGDGGGGENQKLQLKPG